MKYKEQNRLYALLLFAILSISLTATAQSQPISKTTKISITDYYIPNKPSTPTTKRLIRLMQEHPEIELEQWGGIVLPGGGSKASLMMAIAGDTAPDIGKSWFHVIGSEIRNSFLYPLNEWIGEDTDGNGIIDNDETTNEKWKKVPYLWKKVATKDGKIYGIPEATKDHLGVIFRTDLVRAAGLNPNTPPETWEEFMYWCHKLTTPGKEIAGAKVAKGQRGIALAQNGFTFLPWIQSAGGEPIIQYRTSPKSGKKYAFAPEETKFLTPEGESLADEPSEWQANFTSPGAKAAAKLFHDIIWKKWIVHPKTGEPINLTPESITAKRIEIDGQTVNFKESDIITGVGRSQGGQRGQGPFDYLATGEVAMLTWFVGDLNKVGQRVGINPNLLSWFPFPKGPTAKGRRVVQVQNHYAVMYEGVGRRPKSERDKVWETLLAVTDEEVKDNDIHSKVLSGLARFANPEDLKRLSYDEYLENIPSTIKKNFAEIDNGTIASLTEPYMGFWYTVDMALNNEVISLLIAQTGENFNYEKALKEVERKANSGMMFQMTSSDLDKYRPAARFTFGVIAFIIVMLLYNIINQNRKNREANKLMPTATTGNVYNKWLAWGMVVPALLLIATWSYYPLFRGMVMAFQDYKITGDSEYVGLDNFIMLALDSSFWRSLGRTFYFVALNMTFAFTAPILLAVLLTDVPRFKIFFRTLFFLPQMSSGLVIALLWKLMYEPTPQGFFNQIIAILNYIPFVDIAPQQWLQDPALAMICVVVPTIWASMGMASLIYLAALGSIPRDTYEAAEVDGASIFSKFKNVTLPSIYPLIIINFVGAFIGTFQNMGNIFLMTFGGPGEATTVVGLKIWIEAYANLRFSMATAMAWVLGSLLIGFTYFQIKFLGKIEYKRSK